MKCTGIKKNIIIYISIFILTIILFPLKSQAALLDNIIDDADTFLSKDDGRSETIDGTMLTDISTMFFNALVTIGTIISLIYGMYLGIKYMTSTVEDKSDAKQSLIPYIIGNIVLYGSYGIWKMVMVIGQAMKNA